MSDPSVRPAAAGREASEAVFDWSRRHLGVCYYPEHWPEAIWAADATRMADAGITVVRIGEFAWSVLEPRPGELHFAWLDRAIETLADAGLKVILGTPTATPPRWMVTRHPDMIALDREGRPRRFGSRRHVDFSHPGYREEAVRIATLLAERYGDHPALVAWQIDNEYGVHHTVRSYSAAATAAFRAWLKCRYGSIEALNEAWGNVFWSMTYADFADVDLPNLIVTEPNPAKVMAYARFSSDEVVAFNAAQAAVLRQHSPGRTVQHNAMGRFTDFDHFRLGRDLDALSWDSYPLGFLEDRSDTDEHWRDRFARQGDPDFQAFHHDLYRAAGNGRWWVMEQQPGPVNWAPVNPVPLPGMVRLWAWEAFAHGAELVSIFRWRQLPFGQESMHAGLLRPDNSAAPGLAEVAAVAREIADIPPLEPARATVALAFDYAAAWSFEAQPQGAALDYFALVFSAYRALRRLGLSVDIVGPDLAGLEHYKLALAPGLVTLSEEAHAALARTRGEVLLGPRTGAKTGEFQIPAALPPDLSTLLDARVVAVESIRATTPIQTASGTGHFRLWREHVEAGPHALGKPAARDGWPVVVRQNNLTYVAGWPDDDLWRTLIEDAARRADLPLQPLPAGLRVRDHGAIRVVVNYDVVRHTVEGLARGRQVIGTDVLEPAGVAVFLAEQEA